MVWTAGLFMRARSRPLALGRYGDDMSEIAEILKIEAEARRLGLIAGMTETEYVITSDGVEE
jgi:hypothetical protein